MARGDARTAGAGGHREAVPQRLLSAAGKLFARQGFDRTSVQDVVEAAGVTKGALYHYFSSKDDLLREMYVHWLNAQTLRLERIAADRRPVPERLHSAAVDIVVVCIENLDANKVFWRSMHGLAPEVQALVRRERRTWHELFRSLVEEGQRAGDFRPDVPADVVVTYFTGSLHHFGFWYRADGALGPAEVGRYYADLLISSLRPPG